MVGMLPWDSPNPRRNTHLTMKTRWSSLFGGAWETNLSCSAYVTTPASCGFPAAESLVVSVDSVVEGVHFDLSL